MYRVEIFLAENTELLHKPAVWGIEKSEGVDFNHACIHIDGFVYEAVFPRARKIKFSEWLNHFKIIHIYEIVLTEKEYEYFLKTTLEQVGKRYSIFQCFLIWLSNSIGILENFIERTVWNGNKSLICSEFVAWPIIAAKAFSFENKPDTVGMDELKRGLDQVGKKIL